MKSFNDRRRPRRNINSPVLKPFTNEELENLLEDIELAKIYGEDIERAARGESNVIKFNDIAELFDKLEEETKQ